MSRLDELAEWIDGGEGLVLGVDFDGTLSPIVEDHTEPSLSPAARTVLEELAATPAVALAVISGRARADLKERVGVEGAVYAGNHGLELSYGGHETVHPDAVGLRSTIHGLCSELDSRLGDVPGCSIEDKGVTATVHFRGASAQNASRIVDTVERTVSGRDDVHVTAGKQVREIRPRVAWDKGKAMRLLIDATPGWRAMYVGDDTTDEDAFRAIQPDGVGIYVSDDGSPARADETAATYRLDGQSVVPRFLAWLAVSLNTRPFLDGASDPWETFLRFTDDGASGDRGPFARDRSSPEPSA